MALELKGGIGRALAWVAAALATSVRIQGGPVGIRLSLEGPLAQSTLDERLQKIDVARENLRDALNAIEGLRTAAEENRRELDATLQRISEAESQKTNLGAELDTLATLAKLDVEVVRRALGIPSRRTLWLQRVATFLSGVLASLLATLLWSFV